VDDDFVAFSNRHRRVADTIGDGVHEADLLPDMKKTAYPERETRFL
jgi:hypothetical protein